jgi:aminoglycoside phosphotransferase (APT) family kinase protein
MEFIDGDRWSQADFGRSERVSALLDGLSQLHRLRAPALQPLDPVAMARRYAQRLLAHDKANSKRLQRRLDAAANAWQQCCAARRRPAIVHCDLHAGNIVRRVAPEAVPAIALLDWEYAHCGDPLLDFAALCAQHPPLQQPVTAFLAADGSALAQTRLSGDLPAAVAVFRLLSWLWWQERRLLQDLTAEEAQQADVFAYRLDEDLETYAC